MIQSTKYYQIAKKTLLQLLILNYVLMLVGVAYLLILITRKIQNGALLNC